MSIQQPKNENNQTLLENQLRALLQELKQQNCMLLKLVKIRDQVKQRVNQSIAELTIHRMDVQQTLQNRQILQQSS
jgi:hypothetical protein